MSQPVVKKRKLSEPDVNERTRETFKFSNLYHAERILHSLRRRLIEQHLTLSENELKCQQLAVKVADIQAKKGDLFQTENSVDIDGSRRNSRRLVDKLIKSLPTSQEQLAKLQRVIDGDRRNIGQLKIDVQMKSDEMIVLRYWSAVVTFTDLPRELLLEVLKCLGYVYQEKLMR